MAFPMRLWSACSSSSCIAANQYGVFGCRQPDLVELGQSLPGARYASSLDEVRRTIGERSPSGAWILKRPHGFAGRGRRRVAAPLDDGARAFVLATLRKWGGLQVEPWVERRGDFALHGHLDERGDLVLGEPTRQESDDGGAWLDTVRAAPGELEPSERAALQSATEDAARALALAGYFGPFGVDAFRWVDEGGICRFNPRCEVNARYTMGWAVGMGDRRPDFKSRRDWSKRLIGLVAAIRQLDRDRLDRDRLDRDQLDRDRRPPTRPRRASP